MFTSSFFFTLSKLKLKQNKTKYTKNKNKTKKNKEKQRKTKHIISTYLITYLLSPIPQCTQNLSQIFYPDLIMYQQKVCL